MRKLTAFVVLLMLSVVLVACTGDEDEAEPTAAPTDPPVSTRIVESTPEPTDEAAADDDDATPAAGVLNDEMATPPAGDADDATPVMVATPATEEAMQVASPAMIPGTSAATPMATPAAPDTTPAASPAGTPVPSGLNEPPVRIEMTGRVSLEGRENEAYILTDEGCVGLGQYSGLHADRQVVIRNENGTIVSVTLLEASNEAEGCAWSFVAAVPESEFYSVSIPMVFEQVFPKGQVSTSGGVVEIVLP